jgi:peptidoglycan hydrolase CwlO-like protein
MNMKRKIITILLIAIFAVSDVFWFSNSGVKADTAEEIQSHIDDYNKKLKDAQKELDSLQSQQYKNLTQISATKALVNSLTTNIASKEAELKNLNAQAELNKTMLAEYIRQLYYSNQESDPVLQLTVFQGDLDKMVSGTDNIVSIKAKIVDALQIIDDAKTKAEKAKTDLANQQQSKQQTLKIQQAQQAQVNEDIQDTQATIQELNSKLSKLRSNLSALLGEDVSSDDIVKAAKIASSATGVRKDFLLGELVVESDLGRFTGGCTYDKSKMGSTNLSIFKDICSSLGYNYKKMKVSCALSYGIGGAMGIAQFMPTTWKGYKDRIASATGHNPPDPWSVVDGVTAMALYLKNKGADHKSGERNAAAAYYCGSNLSRKVCQDYAKKVLYWADNYEKLLD